MVDILEWKEREELYRLRRSLPSGENATAAHTPLCPPARKVHVRLPGKRNAKSHGSRPVHLIITMIKWIRTSRLSIKNSLCDPLEASTF